VENPQTAAKSTHHGMAIGDGLIDPINQWDYGPVMYRILDLIDERQLEYVNLQTCWQKKRHCIGTITVSPTISSVISSMSSSPNTTGLNDVCYLLWIHPKRSITYVPWVTASEHRRLDPRWQHDLHNDERVGVSLSNDVMQTTIVGKVSVIANNYKVLIYNGLLTT
jgi:hypothetical protein